MEKGYVLEAQASSLFFGDYCVLFNPKANARVLRKDLFVDSAASLQEIEKAVDHPDRSHLNVIFPHEAARAKNLEAICRGIRVSLYYTWLGTSLKSEIEGKRSRR